jgi:pantothenate kinase
MDDLIYNIKKNNNNKKRTFVGICGIPGAGKSTFAAELHSKLSDSIIIPLDGYHKYRSTLTDEQLYYRGRADTFDLQKFKNDFLELLNNENEGHYFPSFQHDVKDPVENDIKVTKEHSIIIFEGLYLFLEELDIDRYFDFKVFFNSDVQLAMERVALRNFKAGITETLEESVKRANESDLLNAYYVLDNSNIDNIIDYI